MRKDLNIYKINILNIYLPERISRQHTDYIEKYIKKLLSTKVHNKKTMSDSKCNISTVCGQEQL